MLQSPDYQSLLTLEDYAERVHDVPYSYTVTRESCSLQVFGADHSNDPQHEQFRQLQEMFQNNPPHCVLLEGIQDELTFLHLHEVMKGLTATEAIINGGEAVYAAWLALSAGSTWQSLEPSDIDLFSAIERLGFERRAIMSWAVLRLLPQYIRREETMTFAEYLEPFVAQIARSTGWSEAYVSSDALLAEATNVLGQSIQLHNEAMAVAYTSPLATLARDGDYTVLNTIAAVATEYRDRAMLETIARAMEHYESVLVVFGASHAVRQEPVLRALGGE